MNDPEHITQPTFRLSVSPQTAVPGLIALGLSIMIAVLSFMLFWQIRQLPSPSLPQNIQFILLLLGITSALFVAATIVVAFTAQRFAQRRGQVETALRRQNEYLNSLHDTALALDNARLYTDAQQELAERKRAGELRDAIYRIAQAASEADNVDELFHLVHKIIKTIMPADNFYIALYDEKNDLLSFPYFVDEIDTPSPPQKPGKGLTEYVLRTAKPLFCTPEVQEKLERSGEAVPVGVPSPVWLGVPLIVDKKAIGVMAVQHYSDPNAYNENDLRVLEFVSSEVAQAIDLTRAQEALQRERDFALQVMNALGQGLSVTGPDRRFEFINPAYARLLGYEPEDLIGQTPEKVTWPEDLPLMEKYRQQRRAGETITYEIRLRHAEGYPIPVLITGTPRWQGDQVVGAITVITDLTGRKRAEEALRKSEQRFRILAENIPGVIYQRKDDERYTLLYVNDAIEDLTGYPKEDFLKDRISLVDLYHPEDGNLAPRSSIEGEKVTESNTFYYSYRIQHKSGEWRWVEEWGTSVYGEDGAFQFFEGFITDITERKLAEAQLERSALELAALSHMGQVVAATLDLSVVLKKVIDEASPLLQAEGISVLLPEGDNKLVFAAASGPASAGLVGCLIPFMAGAAGGVMQTGRSIRITSGESEPQLYREIEQYNEYRTRSLLAVPLNLGGEVIGVMEAVHTQPYAFTVDDQRLLESAANWAAIAIGNARQHERIQRRLQESEAMAAISHALNQTLDLQLILQLIVDSARKVIPIADRALMRLFDDSAQALYPVAASGQPLSSDELVLRSGEGISGRVFAKGVLINVTDTALEPAYLPTDGTAGPTSLLSAPVQSGARRLGALNVMSDELNAFSADDERLLTNLGVQAALAIENARLYETASRRADELNAASEILRALNAAANVTNVFPIIATGLKAITGCERVSFGLYDPTYETFTIVALDQPRSELAVGTRLRVNRNSGSTREILAGHIHVTPDLAVETDAPGQQALVDAGYRSRANLPLRTGQRIIGSLNLSWQTTNGYKLAQLPLLEQIADAIALAVEKNRLFNETAETLVREQRLNEVARAVSGALDLPTILDDITRLAAELVGADASSLALVDDAREQIASIHLFNFPTLFASIPVPRGQGVAWQIIESGKSLFLPDYKSHPNALPEWVEAGACAFLGVPIAVGLDRFGVLGLFSLTPGKTFTARDVSLAESVGLQAGVAIQNARLFEALNKRAAELTTVAQVSIDAATKLNPDELLQKVVDLTKISFHLYHAHIYLLNDAGDTLVLTAGADEVGRRLVADGHQIPLAREQSVVARAARTRRGIIVNDVSNEPLFLPNSLLPDTRSEMAVPMVVSDRLFGVFDVQANIVNRFSDEDVRIQSTLAAQVAVALQNARLFEAERRRVEALTALHETGLELSTQFDLSTLLHSIVERAVRLLEAPLGDLCLLLPDGQTLELSVGYNLAAKYVGTRLKLGEGAAGLAAEIGEPVIVDDYDSWSGRAEMYNHGPFKSVLSVPVTWRGQVIGVIDVSDERISRFSAEDAELVSLFADQAAVAIANARQHEELQRRLQESDALAVISRTFNETLDLQRVLLLIVEAARRIIPNVDRAVIHLLDPDGQTLRPAAVTGVGDPVQSQIIMRPGEGIAGQVIAQGIVINVSDTHSDPRYLVAERASRTRSLLVAPVQSGPHRLGTLSANSSRPHAFSADDERLLGMLGVQAALAISNAQLFEDTRRQLDELLLLHTVAVAGAEATSEDELVERASRLVGQTLNSVNFGVMLLDETGSYLRAHASYQNSPGAPIPLGQGITGRVAATGQPWLVQDVSKEPSYLNVDPNARSELCVPLKAGNLIFGVVNAESDRVNGFTDTDQRLLTTLAGQLATAIQKLRLYHDLEQALRQEKSARAQLVQSEKLAAMGRLVASVAHELNNPLQAIQNALYLVRQEPAISLQSMDDLQVASTEAGRMAELISRLRETYRPATGEEFRLESLNTIVVDVQRLIATHLRHNSIEFRFDPNPDLPLIPGIRDQLKQVMLNLSLNAVEAMPNGGTLTVRTRHQPATSGVLLSIHDTGSGIPPDALNNVFDPFFTTKESGTGLGLTITYDIIQRHKGRIEVESEPGRGATFTIWLPVEIESELT